MQRLKNNRLSCRLLKIVGAFSNSYRYSIYNCRAKKCNTSIVRYHKTPCLPDLKIDRPRQMSTLNIMINIDMWQVSGVFCPESQLVKPERVYTTHFLLRSFKACLTQSVFQICNDVVALNKTENTRHKHFLFHRWPVTFRLHSPVWKRIILSGTSWFTEASMH